MKTFIVWLSFIAVCGAEMGSVVSGAMPASESPKSPSAMPDMTIGLSEDSTLIEEGKALYENGQMIAALGKFMTVLRKDPHNAEARQYLRMIVDIMRQNPSITSSKMGTQEQAVASNPAVQEEIRRMLQLRSRLTMDLKAIPGVSMEVKTNVNQVWIESSLLFAENSGGLKEQGVPILDRVAAWLRTYGQQPVIIHCYPEELQEASTNGSLFLHRYSELFNFFVEEKKLPPQRLVSADLLKAGAGEKAPDDVSVSSKTPHVVIETIGSQSAMLDAMPSMNSMKALSQWLENSITLNRKVFNPEEGEWVNLDVAAMTRMGLRTWTFTIAPSNGKAVKPVFQMDGKGNLLKRLSWDGHDQKTGSFVSAGTYLAKLSAVNSDGTIKNQEEVIQVERTTQETAVLVNKPKPKPVKKAAVKKPQPKPVVVAKASPPKVTPKPAPLASSPADSGRGPMGSPPTTGGNDVKKDDSDSLIDAAPAATPPAAEDAGDSAHTIWKQVIQFEPGQSDLKPTIKASLERIGKTLEVYPLQKVRIMGFAMVSESNASQLAHKRAEAVRSILVEEYHVDQKRVIVAGGQTTSDENASKVEMSITN